MFCRVGECSDSCKMRRRDLETDLKQIRRDLLLREEQFRQLERETQVRPQLWEIVSTEANVNHPNQGKGHVFNLGNMINKYSPICKKLDCFYTYFYHN